MQETDSRVVLCLTAAALSLCCAGSLAVPKAAEHEDAPVSYGEAAAPPRPTNKAAAKTAVPTGRQAVVRPQAGMSAGAAAPKASKRPTLGKVAAPKKPPEQAARSTRKK